jgi:glycosyltransferase involved in cell wall biosynthesis
MKLVVMIPAYNEERTISSVIKDIPRIIQGIDEVKVLVVDDGSTDNTFKEAQAAGADKMIVHRKNKGLAVTFKDGLDGALSMGADIIVNTDADGQYSGSDIPLLIDSIVNGKADVVLGDRQIWSLGYMPLSKKIGNSISSWIVRRTSGLPVTDAQTGFRAFTKEAALKLNIISDFTYTQETLIQMPEKKLTYGEIKIKSNQGPERKSRLFSSIWSYAKKSGITIVRAYRDYKPIKVFGLLGSLTFLLGVAFGMRPGLNFILTGAVSPYVPSAILSAVLLIVGFQIIIFGFLADMIRNNGKFNNEILYRLKKKDLE